MNLEIESIIDPRVQIESGIFLKGKWLKDLQKTKKKIALITDENINKFWGESIFKSLGIKPFLILPPGEKYKTRKMKEKIENHLFQSGYGRDSIIIALGGGVVTDLVGFVAATFCRGVDLVFIPTSLLGMVDASVGGKVGLNHPLGKNLIGAFYNPTKILIDIMLLKTLPKKDFCDGMSEVIKYGLILDSNFLDEIRASSTQILNQNAEFLNSIVRLSVSHKLFVVHEDEKEGGMRRILNFGHTLAHALENASRFEMTHGHAIAIGSLFAIEISEILNELPEGSFEDIKRVFYPFHRDLKISEGIDRDNIWGSLKLDKKSQEGVARFVLLNAIGSCASYEGAYCKEISKDIFDKAWKRLI